jgi:hypothetical protein
VRWANRTINELDVFPLHILRLVLVEAGLLRRRRGFHLSSDAKPLLADAGAGELYLRLFLAFFRRLNLAYLDRGAAHPGLQESIPDALRMLQSQAAKWKAPPELARRIWPVGALDPLDGYERIDPDGSLLRLTEARLFYPLFDFGLLERRLLRKTSDWEQPYRIRKTPLYDRFIRFGAAT